MYTQASKVKVEVGYDQKTILWLSTLIREFTAIAALLILESRLEGYDMFNSAMVLFIILVMVRVPYVNSYVYLFEKLTWDFGARSNVNDEFFFAVGEGIAVLGGHIAGAAAAAAMRVTLDVNYGREVHGLGSPNVRYGLATNADSLAAYDSYWKAGDRRSCFSARGLNGTVTKWFPLTNADRDYCLDVTSIGLWYFCEEAVYVLMLCMTYVHVWQLTTRRVERQDVGGVNPLGRWYWETLFKLSFLLCFLNVALARAFPTAHGSLHKSMYLYMVDLWSPQPHLIDDRHNEIALRVVGGIVGAGLGWVYAYVVHATLPVKAGSDSPNLLYCFVWGMPPPAPEAPVAAVASASAAAADGGGGKATVGSAYGVRSHGSDFKLRIPYSLM